MRRSAIAALLAFALVGTLTACDAVPLESSPTGSERPTPTSSTLPAPATPRPITCETLVPDLTRDRMLGDGWSPVDDYAGKLRAGGNTLVAFADYGGDVCLWGPPNGHGAIFAASPIDESQEATQRARLASEGFPVVSHNGADLYELADPGGVFAYLFVPGYWFLGNSVDDVDRIRQTLDVG